jgi:hypothetical protein
MAAGQHEATHAAANVARRQACHRFNKEHHTTSHHTTPHHTKSTTTYTNSTQKQSSSTALNVISLQLMQHAAS